MPLESAAEPSLASDPVRAEADWGRVVEAKAEPPSLGAMSLFFSKELTYALWAAWALSASSFALLALRSAASFGSVLNRS